MGPATSRTDYCAIALLDVARPELSARGRAWALRVARGELAHGAGALGALTDSVRGAGWRGGGVGWRRGLRAGHCILSKSAAAGLSNA